MVSGTPKSGSAFAALCALAFAGILVALFGYRVASTPASAARAAADPESIERTAERLRELSASLAADRFVLSQGSKAAMTDICHRVKRFSEEQSPSQAKAGAEFSRVCGRMARLDAAGTLTPAEIEGFLFYMVKLLPSIKAPAPPRTAVDEEFSRMSGWSPR